MGNLISLYESSNLVNIKVFNDLQHTISGWPGGKPNADDSTRPERALPYPKKVIIFSPHPDDDVISMGGTFARLVQQGHEVHVAYQTSGSIAVSDDDALSLLDSVNEYLSVYDDRDFEIRKIYRHCQEFLASKKPGDLDIKAVRTLKAAIRRGEARAACRYFGMPDERIHFLDLPFYETGVVKKAAPGPEDIAKIAELMQVVKPHQIYAAGDLSDPHGTHRICMEIIIQAIHQLKNEAWMKDCRMWLYRGAWQEWDVDQVDMAVPLSPDEVMIKRKSIYKHKSQNNGPLYPGTDSREFWQRAEDRNHATAELYDRLGMAEYQAIELFVRYKSTEDQE
jgi:glucosamine-6-phosphate deaminase